MNEKELLALLAVAGAAAYTWVQLHAAVIVGYLDKYWDPRATNKQLEDGAVLIFRTHLLGPLTPENMIRAAVRRVCRWRKRLPRPVAKAKVTR